MASKKKSSNENRAYLWGFATGIFVATLVVSFFEKSGTPVMPGVNSKTTTATLASNCAQAPRAPQSVEAPLLPPPEFSDDLPDLIEATQKGEADVEWKAVPKALSYTVTVTDLKGHRLNFLKTPFTNITLRDLRTRNEDGETHYLVSVASVNIDGKPGTRNKPRKIVVRDRPDITAPTIKSIKTED